MLSALCLPTPEGYAVMLVRAQSGYRGPALRAAQMLTNYLYITMQGTLSR